MYKLTSSSIKLKTTQKKSFSKYYSEYITLVNKLCVRLCIHKLQLDIPLWLRLLDSTGLKCIVGIGQTSCIGSASIRHAFFLSHPAPCRYKPFTYTPSCTKSINIVVSVTEWRNETKIFFSSINFHKFFKIRLGQLSHFYETCLTLTKFKSYVQKSFVVISLSLSWVA